MGPKKRNNKNKGGNHQQQQQNKLNTSTDESKSITVSCDDSTIDNSGEISSPLNSTATDTSDLSSSLNSTPSLIENEDSNSNSQDKEEIKILIENVDNNKNSQEQSQSQQNINENLILNEISKLYSVLSLVSNNVIDIKEKVNHNNHINHNNHNNHNHLSGSSGINNSGEVFNTKGRSDSFSSNGDINELTAMDWKSMYLKISQQYQIEKKRNDDLEIQVKDLSQENHLLSERIKVLESHVEVEKKKFNQAFGTIRSGSKKLTMKLGKGNVDISSILDELGRDMDTISTSDIGLDKKLTENAQSMLNKLNSFTPHNSASELLSPEEQLKTQLHAAVSAPVSTPVSISASNSQSFASISPVVAEDNATTTATEQKVEEQSQSVSYKDINGQVVTVTYTHEQIIKIVKVQSYVKRWYAQLQFKKLKTKRLAVGELFETESTYVSHLSNLLKIFLAPLRVRLQNGESLISAHDMDRIFSTSSTIFKSNSIFLHQMEDMYKNFNRWSLIGNRMLEQLPLFESYIEYIINFDLGQQSLKKSMNSNSFASYIKTAETNPLLGDLDLPDLLIMPVQRIPRYIMLIQQIKKYTQPSHPDFAPLGRALDAFKKFADGINERKGMRIKALQLEDKIIGYKEDITSKSRYLIREGPLRYKKNTEYIFLFNDMIMICHPQYKKSKIRLTSTIGGNSGNSSGNLIGGIISTNSNGTSKDGSTSPSLLQPGSGSNGSTSPGVPSSPSQDHHHEVPCSYKFITRVMLDARVKIVQDSQEPKFLTIIPDLYSIELTATSPEERQHWVKDLITLVTIFTNNLLNNPSNTSNIIPNSSSTNSLSSSSRENSLN